jgi:hypothetical protein
MYDLEHEEFFAAIRSGNRKDDAAWIGHSTTLAILGRTACYSGKRITWEDMLASKDDLAPEETLKWGDSFDAGPVPLPGVKSA